MAAKRRSVHVDWDSPSAKTGTVKRRPASLSASFQLRHWAKTGDSSVPESQMSKDPKQAMSMIPVRRLKGSFGLKLPKSGIPRLKTSRTNDGLVQSSSESSGFGSPLSPLSPLKDASAEVVGVKSSGSKSSGLGSPDSPLSPDSQQYAALYLIQQQLEKLRSCPCERRQAEVKSRFKKRYGSFRHAMRSSWVCQL